MSEPKNVLFLCTANSARSILGEGILRALGGDSIRAFSAGSHPRGTPNPMALIVLAGHGHDVAGLASKSWDVFAEPGAPKMDVVITVCDAAAGESCPYWPGSPLTAHWGIADPAAAPEPEQRAAILDAYRQLSARITSLVNLPVETMDLASLKKALIEIARLEGATPLALQRAA